MKVSDIKVTITIDKLNLKTGQVITEDNINKIDNNFEKIANEINEQVNLTELKEENIKSEANIITMESFGDVSTLAKEVTMARDGKSSLNERLKEDKTSLLNGLNKVNADLLDSMKQISQLSNPNLLINSYFGNPINQRAKAIYNTNGYTIDRWYMNAENGSLSVNDGYITLTSNATSSNTLLTQKFDTEFSKLNGTKLTLTIKYKTTSLDKFRIALCGVDTYVDASTEWNEKKITIDISSFVYALGTSQLMIQFYNGSNMITGTISIAYIKLELGYMSTPFIPKPYAEEDLICKKYYQRMGNGITGFVDTATNLLMSFQFVTQMRVAPTISMLLSSFYCLGLTNCTSIINYECNNKGVKYLRLLYTSTNRSLGNFVYVDVNADVFVIDAEIY